MELNRRQEKTTKNKIGLIFQVWQQYQVTSYMHKT